LTKSPNKNKWAEYFDKFSGSIKGSGIAIGKDKGGITVKKDPVEVNVIIP
jgi:hypothetical protein